MIYSHIAKGVKVAMRKWLLNGCPRCGGDMFKTYEGEFLEIPEWRCLYCGKSKEIKLEPKFEIRQLELAEAK